MSHEVEHPADQRLLTPQQLADHLAVPVTTIYQWRYRSQGPRGFKIGGHVRYRWSDVAAWLEHRADGWR